MEPNSGSRMKSMWERNQIKVGIKSNQNGNGMNSRWGRNQIKVGVESN